MGIDQIVRQPTPITRPDVMDRSAEIVEPTLGTNMTDAEESGASPGSNFKRHFNLNQELLDGQ